MIEASFTIRTPHGTEKAVCVDLRTQAPEAASERAAFAARALRKLGLEVIREDIRKSGSAVIGTSPTGPKAEGN